MKTYKIPSFRRILNHSARLKRLILIAGGAAATAAAIVSGFDFIASFSAFALVALHAILFPRATSETLLIPIFIAMFGLLKTPQMFDFALAVLPIFALVALAVCFFDGYTSLNPAKQRTEIQPVFAPASRVRDVFWAKPNTETPYGRFGPELADGFFSFEPKLNQPRIFGKGTAKHSKMLVQCQHESKSRQELIFVSWGRNGQKFVTSTVCDLETFDHGVILTYSTMSDEPLSLVKRCEIWLCEQFSDYVSDGIQCAEGRETLALRAVDSWSISKIIQAQAAMLLGATSNS